MPKKFDKNRRNRDLLKKYGITEQEYDQMLAQQGGVCKICGKPPTGRALHVEHDHRLARAKVRTQKIEKGWLAKTNDPRYPKLNVEFVLRTKSEAIKAVKHVLLRFSIRSLSCWACNSMLKWGHDDPKILIRAAELLHEHNSRFN